MEKKPFCTEKQKIFINRNSVPKLICKILIRKINVLTVKSIVTMAKFIELKYCHSIKAFGSTLFER